MSDYYRLRISESVSAVVHISDTVTDALTQQVAIDPILAPEAMRDLVAAALTARGWQRDGDVFHHRDEADCALEWDLVKMEVTARASKSAREKKTVTRAVITGRGRNQAEARADAQRQLNTCLGEEQARLMAELWTRLGDQVARQLVEGLPARTQQLNLVVRDVYAQALKEKARSLGEVVEVSESENGDQFQLTIRVKD